MLKPNADYRENPQRAIYISGQINQALVDKVTPQINEYRLTSSNPITVYIDSPGGSIILAETIRHHLTAPNPEGQRCRIITVVTSRAASAAADLFCLGDYAIIYSYGDLLYHGARTGADSSLTTEAASTMARSLQQSNEVSAVRLAKHAFPRFILRLTQFRPEFVKFIANPSIDKFCGALQKELLYSNAQMVAEARKRQKIIGDLGASVFKHMKRLKGGGLHLSASQFECEMLKGIVKYKSNLHKSDPWLLSVSGLQEITDDFNLLHDFHFGSQKSELERWNKTYGQIFLLDTEKEEQKNLTGTEDEKAMWLIGKSEPKLRPIWYLMVSICRLLQNADYTISSHEAYWLGLADEVPGSGLPSIRIAEEFVAPSKKGQA